MKIEDKEYTLKSGGKVMLMQWLKGSLESVPMKSGALVGEIRSRLKILDKMEADPNTDFSADEIKIMQRCVAGTTWLFVDKAVDEFCKYFEELK